MVHHAESQTAEYDKWKGRYCRRDDKRCQISRKIPEKKGQSACISLCPGGKLSLWIQVRSFLCPPLSLKQCERSDRAHPAPLQTAALHNSRLGMESEERPHRWCVCSGECTPALMQLKVSFIPGKLYLQAVPRLVWIHCNKVCFSAALHYTQQTFHLLQRGQWRSHSGVFMMLSGFLGLPLAALEWLRG